MPAVKITNKPIGIPGDDTHFIVTQPELPEGYTPTGQETEEELAELKVESVREIGMDDMVELIQDKLDMDVAPTTGSNKPVTSGGIKAALDLMDDDISSLNEDITNLQTNKQDALTFDQTPTAESTNPVTSVGIKNAIEAAVDVTAPGIYETVSGSIVSFADGADDLPMKSAVVSIEPIQEGSGDPSPENVRPISGRTVVKVTRTGKNLLNASQANEVKKNGAAGFTLDYLGDNTVRMNTSAAGAYYVVWEVIKVAPNMVGKSITVSNDENANIYIYKTGKDGSWASSPTAFPSNVRTITFTEDDVGRAFGYGFYNASGTTKTISHAQVEFGSTYSAYEPYQGNTYDIEFPSEAGTVYGGTLDIVSGKLAVDRAIKVFDGSENWNNYPAFRGYYSLINAMKKGMRQSGICNMLKTTSQTNQTNAIWFGVDTKYIYAIGVYDSMGSTVEDFKTYLSEHNLEVVYPLETPTEIQLTPQEVRTLLGENNIWSDSGDVEVEYPADTKMYIDQKITEAIAAALA